MKLKTLFLTLVVSMSLQAQLTWNFTSGMDGWHDLGAGRDVTASWENGKLKMTYIDGGDAGTQLWFAAVQVDNLSFNAADYKYLQINYQTNNWPTSSPVKMLVTLTKTDNSVIYSYFDIDPTKNFLSIDIAANNPGWGGGQLYAGTIKSVQFELPHNGAAISNPATNWYSATTLIDRVQFSNYKTTAWDFKTTTEGWGSYGGDLTLSNTGDGNLTVSHSSPSDGTLDYTAIYNDTPVDVSNVDLFYMKFTATNWPKTSALVNIIFEMGGTYYANKIMNVASGELSFNIRTENQNNWGPLPATGTTTRIRIEIPHSSELTGFNWASASLKIDKIAFSKVSDVTEAIVSSDVNLSSLVKNATTELLVNTGSTLTINETTTLKSITTAPGGKVTLSSGILTATNGINLQSDATGTATLVDNTTNAPQAITATVQQYVEAGRNWYMSIPLASGASSLLNKGTSVVCFDETTSTWIAPVANTLDKLRGYVQVATSTPSITGTTGTLAFTGVVNTGAHSITLSRTAGKTGFNLVGNPYPSYLDWNAVTKTNVSNTMWFRTKEGSVYKFYTYVANSGAGVGSPATVTNKIPPMQAFWVRVNTEGTGSIAVDNNMRSHKDVAGNIMKAPSQTPQQLLRLQVSNGTNTDETVLYFNANASDAFDQFDAQKRSNDEPAVPEIYTQVGTEQLVINGMNSVKYNTEIPIGFSTLTAANNLSISANEMTNFETGTRVILIDKLNPSIETELTNGAAYNFIAPVTVPTTNRFSLLFRAPGSITDVNATEKLNAQVFVNANNQITIIAPEKSNYAIFNAMGQLISTGVTISNYQTSIPIAIGIKLAEGVYFVSLSVNGLSEVKKVIIR